MNHKDPLKVKLNELLNGHSLAQLFCALEAIIQELNYPEIAEHLHRSRLLLQPDTLALKQPEDYGSQHKSKAGQQLNMPCKTACN